VGWLVARGAIETPNTMLLDYSDSVHPPEFGPRPGGLLATIAQELAARSRLVADMNQYQGGGQGGAGLARIDESVKKTKDGADGPGLKIKARRSLDDADEGSVQPTCHQPLKCP
jgi:hypothetical protein